MTCGGVSGDVRGRSSVQSVFVALLLAGLPEKFRTIIIILCEIFSEV